MSSWTYVTGTITVDVYGRTQPECRYILDTVLEHLPKVTGSESNLSTYVIQKNHIRDEYIIVLDGELRDRYFEDTFNELNKFLNRLAKRLNVSDICVKVHGYDSSFKYKTFTFSNYAPYFEMYEIDCALLPFDI